MLCYINWILCHYEITHATTTNRNKVISNVHLCFIVLQCEDFNINNVRRLYIKCRRYLQVILWLSDFVYSHLKTVAYANKSRRALREIRRLYRHKKLHQVHLREFSDVFNLGREINSN